MLLLGTGFMLLELAPTIDLKRWPAPADEGRTMPGTIDFRYDAATDIIVATPKWRLATKEDCEEWFSKWDSYLSKFHRKVDCVVVLNDFHVDPQIASAWGEYRAKLNRTYFRHSFRVNADATVKLFVKTSGVRFNAATSEAESVEAAIEGILEARKKA
jgi:hypothetical protein